MEFSTTGRVQSGKLLTRNLKQMNAALASWKDCEVTILIEKKHAHRSHQANRYYWGVIVDHISAHTGYTPEETHEALKTMFLPKRLAMLGQNGQEHGELVIGGSTTRLNTVEFFEYCTQIREWALRNLEVDIPLPESEAA